MEKSKTQILLKCRFQLQVISGMKVAIKNDLEKNCV